MKKDLIFRKVTKSGGLTIPSKVRADLDIQKSDPIELEQKDGELIVRRYTPRCTFCGSKDDIVLHLGKGICKSCREKIGG